MNITVNLDDTQFSKLVSDGINALDEETVKDIAKKSLTEAFQKPELAEAILFDKSTWTGEKTLKSWAQDAIGRALTEADYAEFKTAIFNVIRNEAKDIITSALAKTLTDNLFTYQNSANFQTEIMRAIKG